MGRQRPAIGPARFRAGGGNWRVAYIPRCRVEYILWSRRPIGRGPASMDRKGRTILAKNLKALRDLHAMTQEDLAGAAQIDRSRSEEHTPELQSLMRISYAVFCLKKKKERKTHRSYTN